MSTVLVNVKHLTEIVVEILVRLGENKKNALIASDAFVVADMRGINTHGIFLLRLIYERVKAKMLHVPSDFEVVSDKMATSVIDGKNGIGQVIASHGMQMSISKAKQWGIGIVAMRNINNIGTLGYYTCLAAEHDMVGILTTNGNPAIAPWGSTEPFFGTNPISIAFPVEGGPPLFLDMSCSVVARGKIRASARNGKKIPLGWAQTKTGEPTTDPEEALQGSLFPIGGPKGSALAMMVDIFAGMLSGSSYGPQLKTFHQLHGPTGAGATCIAIDINKFMDSQKFAFLLKEYLKSIKNLKKRDGVSEIFLPGEIELKNEIKSRYEKIILPRKIAADINKILKDVGAKEILRIEL